MSNPDTTTGAMASGSDAGEILARLWCRAEGNDPDDTISDAGHTVLDGLLSGQDRKALAAIRQAETELRAALAAPAPVVPEELRALSEAATQGRFGVEASADGDTLWVGILRPDGVKLERIIYSVRDLLSYLPEYADRARSDAAFIIGLINWFRTLAATPSKPVGDGGEASAPPAGGGAVPEGWRLVPVEPTEEMQQAGWIDKEDVSPKEIWWAMLAAAPAAPEPAAGGGREQDEDVREIDRILAMSGDELHAELVAEGHNPDALVRQMKHGLDGTLRLAADRQRWREEAASWRRVAERLEEEKRAILKVGRERIAKIIDGEAFKAGDANYYGPTLNEAAFGARKRVALYKADAILSAHSEAETAGGAGWRFDMEAAPRDGSDVEIVNDRGQFIAQFDETWYKGGWWLVSDGKDPDRPLRGDEPFAWRVPTKAPPKPTPANAGAEGGQA